MKKLKLIIAAMLISFAGFSQEKGKEIAKASAMDVTLMYHNDSSYVIVYRNRKYAKIINYESITFSSKEEVLNFVKDCRTSMESSTTLSKGKYQIFDSNSRVACVRNSSGGFTYINSKFLKEIEESVK